jgi:hypothetical protein
LSEAIRKIDQYIREEEAECNDDSSAIDNLRLWRVSTLIHEKYIDELAAENAELKWRMSGMRSLLNTMLTNCAGLLTLATEPEELN